MFKRGGMKKLFEATAIKTPTIASTSVVTLEEKPVYGSLGPEGTVHVTVLD